MRKPFILLFFLFVLNVFSQSETKLSPIICTSFIETDKIRVVLSCQSSEAKECADDGIIAVRVTPSMLDLKIPKIKYKVSGGKIIGKGELVKWDLRGVKPGHYTVTAEVEEKDGFPQKGAKTVTVIECENCLNKQTQTVADNEDVTVENLILEKTKVTLACPFTDNVPNFGICSEENRRIGISTISKDAEKKGLTYYYFITGGKIIGEGANVVWDFTGARPGDYSITVGVGKNDVVKGSLITKMVIAYSCGCSMPCVCYSVSVSGPDTFNKRGDSLIFTAEVRGDKQEKYDYKWKVSDGVIVFGQGTKQILVKTNKNSKDEIVTATVEIDGQCVDCQREFSTSTKFTGR